MNAALVTSYHESETPRHRLELANIGDRISLAAMEVAVVGSCRSNTSLNIDPIRDLVRNDCR